MTKSSGKYGDKIATHINELVSTLPEEEEPRTLGRFKPTDLKPDFRKYYFTGM
jgi:hypothetical protein